MGGNSLIQMKVVFGMPSQFISYISPVYFSLDLSKKCYYGLSISAARP